MPLPDDLPAEVFLDTSIHLASMKGGDLSRRVHATLREFRWRGTASYAKVEYGNNVLSCVCYYRRMLRQFGSLERLRYHIANVLNPKLAAHQKHQVWFSNLLSKCIDPKSDGEATERASRELAHLWRLGTTVVDALCDHVNDDIKCICADQRNASQWKVPDRRCERTRPGCRLPEFFQDNRELFSRMRDVIRGLAPNRQTVELDGLAAVVDAACSNPQALRDHAVCRRFGDAIMAVQSHGYRSFFTQNERESDTLCKVLGQLLLYLHQCPEDEVEVRDYRSARPTEANTPCDGERSPA
ncbi:MAG: hypothetical protein FJ290_12200 [Planctomycetes bacterium]|nr:hypothetical protein [Planctomycetota bacterium]